MKTNCSWGNNLATKWGNCMICDVRSQPSHFSSNFSSFKSPRMMWVQATPPGQPGQRVALLGLMKLSPRSGLRSDKNPRPGIYLIPNPVLSTTGAQITVDHPCCSHLNNLMLWIHESPGKIVLGSLSFVPVGTISITDLYLPQYLSLWNGNNYWNLLPRKTCPQMALLIGSWTEWMDPKTRMWVGSWWVSSPPHPPELLQ